MLITRVKVQKIYLHVNLPSKRYVITEIIYIHTHTHTLCPESIKVYSHVIKKIETFTEEVKKIQDTRNIVHRTMMPQSPSK